MGETMLLKEVIGQEATKNYLLRQVQLGKVGHAQMFLGPLGHGGLPLALAYAQYLNCENPGDTDSCGICGSCVKAQKYQHPDIHFSFPFPSVDKKKTANESLKEWREVLLENPYLPLQTWMIKFNAENKQANIPITECQEILRKLTLKTYEGKYKVMILWLPEFLGKEGNSLLKMIEEPPDNTVFLLVAENPDQILNTILSRTQIVKIPMIESAALAAHLQEVFNLDEEEAYRLAELSNGDRMLAHELHQHAANEHTEQFNAWMQLLLEGNVNRPELLRWVDQFAATGREAQKNFFLYLLHQLRELIQARISKQPSRLLTVDEQRLHHDIGRRLNLERLQQVYSLFNEGHYYLERNANPKILLLNMSVKLNKLLNGKTLTSQQQVKSR